jgi:hypothetical protein
MVTNVTAMIINSRILISTDKYFTFVPLIFLNEYDFFEADIIMLVKNSTDVIPTRFINAILGVSIIEMRGYKNKIDITTSQIGILCHRS